MRLALSLQPAPGTLLLRSSPPHVAVTLGRQYLGQTPALIRDLGPGEHKLRFEAPGYRAETHRVVVAESRAAELSVQLQPLTGVLRIVTLPGGADVYVNGKRAATTEEAAADQRHASPPLEIAGLLPGEHRVQCRLRGLASTAETVRVAPAQRSLLRHVIWIPYVEVVLRSGETHRGMVWGVEPNGALRFSPNPEERLSLPPQRIEALRYHDFADAVARALLGGSPPSP